MRRVVITGMGAISAAGRNIAELSASLREGRSGLGPISLFDASSFQVQAAGEAGLPPGRTDRATRLLFEAATQAMEHAGLTAAELSEAALCIGSGAGEVDGILASQQPDASPFCASTPTNRLADLLRVRGPVTTIMTACASGTNAIGLAADLVRLGLVDRAICGGVDAVSLFLHSGFEALHTLSSQGIRPFDRNRSGMILGEAGAVLILEEAESAIRRGAPVHAVLCGYGLSNDAYHYTQPDPTATGAIAAIRRCLTSSGLTREDIDYVNAHGTGTLLNDAMEMTALAEIFGPHLLDLPISSTKPIHGHALGAGGALEAIVCVIALKEQFVPPTLGLTEPEGPPMRHIRGRGQPARLRTALSASLAFYGNNAALALKTP